MPYCTTSDVLTQLHMTLSTGSLPTSAEVDQYCVEISAEMDSRMRAVGIEVPVTDADRIQHLKEIAINGVASKVLLAAHQKGQDPEWQQTYQDLYNAKMARIEDRPAIVGVTDKPQMPQGRTRSDRDIAVTRRGGEW